MFAVAFGVDGEFVAFDVVDRIEDGSVAGHRLFDFGDAVGGAIVEGFAMGFVFEVVEDFFHFPYSFLGRGSSLDGYIIPPPFPDYYSISK